MEATVEYSITLASLFTGSRAGGLADDEYFLLCTSGAPGSLQKASPKMSVKPIAFILYPFVHRSQVSTQTGPMIVTEQQPISGTPTCNCHFFNKLFSSIVECYVSDLLFGKLVDVPVSGKETTAELAGRGSNVIIVCANMGCAMSLEL
ncbi:unnamed protein product [Rodentolepis nana]|uniref:Uncharacterized protein n=1 Tax=Rodentolepis nana TaxID=102285 RepID=A0A0R3TTP1_RODNA|nr:unnamed protein product [Rodentolepis nana]